MKDIVASATIESIRKKSAIVVDVSTKEKSEWTQKLKFDCYKKFLIDKKQKKQNEFRQSNSDRSHYSAPQLTNLASENQLKIEDQIFNMVDLVLKRRKKRSKEKSTGSRKRLSSGRSPGLRNKGQNQGTSIGKASARRRPSINMVSGSLDLNLLTV